MVLAAVVVTMLLVVVIVVSAHRGRNEREKHTTGGVINSVAATGARVRAELERELRAQGKHALTKDRAPILVSGHRQYNPSSTGTTSRAFEPETVRYPSTLDGCRNTRVGSLAFRRRQARGNQYIELRHLMAWRTDS
jgi:hypothetical protein